jgi:hypothetical protein
VPRPDGYVSGPCAPIKQLTTAMWRRECKAAGLEGVTFHTMRHTWASWQVQAGAPMRMLQELGGWSSLQMPGLYSHIDPGHLSEYALRTLLGESPTDSPTVDVGSETDDPEVIEFGGKGGTRTLDPGIMRDVDALYSLCIQLLMHLLKPPSGR